MSFPRYFQEFNNIKYAVSTNKAGIPSYINIKNYFHLARLRDDIFKEDTLYTQYYVRNGERPENISYELYGDEQYYWILLQINDIVDYYNQWPLSSTELEKHIVKKYGSWTAAELPHHWETVETFDDNGNLVVPGGITVNQNFVYVYPNTPGSGIDVVEKSSFPRSVSNAEYEQRLNEEKSNIVILKEEYIIDYVRETNLLSRRVEAKSSSVSISDNFR
ncbi:baseplate wedge protein [Synechococcus phage S-CRM01]|uniref:baseplate wedge subunit n=1 Tax=Synechococcus phage S-CRM01 TaxID=1026955 RepID=UPI000209E380|nr:baseplate wedge subunit [Synechococcus phage S-CRM01]AEC53014.1 baseplate wedge protein [Synechococcus phage S-CRM01]